MNKVFTDLRGIEVWQLPPGVSTLMVGKAGHPFARVKGEQPFPFPHPWIIVRYDPTRSCHRVYVSPTEVTSASDYAPYLGHFFNYTHGITCGGAFGSYGRGAQGWFQSWIMSSWTQVLYMNTCMYPPQLKKYMIPRVDDASHYRGHALRHDKSDPRNDAFHWSLSEEFSTVDPEELCTWDWVRSY